MVNKKKVKVISKAYSLQGFELKRFLLSFERPFVILIVYLLGLVVANPQLAPIISILGGVAVISERLWAIVKFYITEYIED